MLYAKKWARIISAFLAATLLLCGCGQNASSGSAHDASSAHPAADTADQSQASPAAASDSSDPIVIGATLPLLSGDFGFLMNKAAELAVNEANEKGGVLGRPIKLIVEDDGVKPDTGIKAMKLIIEQKPDVLLGSHHSEILLAQADLVKEYAHPQITTAGGVLPYRNGNSWIFSGRSGDVISVAALGGWALEQGYHDFGIITDTRAWPAGYKDEFIRWVSHQDPAATFQVEEFTSGDQDMTAQFTKLMDKECILLSAYTGDFAILAPQVKRLGYQGQILGCNALGASYLFDMVGDACDGFVGETNYLVGTDIPEWKEFDEKFEAYAGVPPTEISVTVYDVINLYLHAVEQAGTTEPGAVREAMLGIKDFQGVQGPLGYYPNGEVSNRRLLFKVVGNKYEIIENYEVKDYDPVAYAEMVAAEDGKS